eukprot:TRINITY_DN10490_c0_g3_i1.p1 TRINITY_DN10490_c0_g3~~TRINITY_DN10490_c0_g3_i1.p1  ORF type:complete len:380 (+),score=50.76 TRINITY_DN10490_c0_g3_i1:78-1217(+)
MRQGSLLLSQPNSKGTITKTPHHFFLFTDILAVARLHGGSKIGRALNQAPSGSSYTVIGKIRITDDFSVTDLLDNPMESRKFALKIEVPSQLFDFGTSIHHLELSASSDAEKKEWVHSLNYCLPKCLVANAEDNWKVDLRMGVIATGQNRRLSLIMADDEKKDSGPEKKKAREISKDRMALLLIRAAKKEEGAEESPTVSGGGTLHDIIKAMSETSGTDLAAELFKESNWIYERYEKKEESQDKAELMRIQALYRSFRLYATLPGLLPEDTAVVTTLSTSQVTALAEEEEEQEDGVLRNYSVVGEGSAFRRNNIRLKCRCRERKKRLSRGGSKIIMNDQTAPNRRKVGGFSPWKERLTVEIGRAVQQECRDRSRMPSSA